MTDLFIHFVIYAVLGAIILGIVVGIIRNFGTIMTGLIALGFTYLVGLMVIHLIR